MKENRWLRLERMIHRILKLGPPAPPMFLDEDFEGPATQEVKSRHEHRSDTGADDEATT